MKIHNPKPKPVVRIQIAKAGQKPEYVTFSECSMDQVVDHVKNRVMRHCLIFPTGKKTSITARNGLGVKNLKSKTVGIYTEKSNKEILNIICENVQSN